MKRSSPLWGSVSVLIGVVIAILALVRGAWLVPLLLLVFTAWGLWVVMFQLQPAWDSIRGYSRLFDTTTRRHIMQYTDNEAALIGGLISNYFLRPAVSAALKDSYTRVLEHLRTGRVSAADLKQIQKALAFLTPTCQMSREAQRDLMGASLKTTALLSSCR